MNKPESIKITIHIQRRRDGGLRAWSRDVPGLVLSHSDHDKVMADIVPAVETIMTEVLGYPVQASQLVAVPKRADGAHRKLRFGRWLQASWGGAAAAQRVVLEYVAAPVSCTA